MELGRPITNGIIMCGNTTKSRKGTIGKVSITSPLSLSRGERSEATRPPARPRRQGEGRYSSRPFDPLSDLLDEGDRLLPVEHHFPGDHALLDLLHRGEVVHEVQHQVLDDHPQPTCPDLA